MGAREDQIARIQQIERIKAMEGKNQFARPAEEPPSWTDPVNDIQHAIKPLDYQGGLVRTAAAKLLGVSKPDEGWDVAGNPLDKHGAPGWSEIMARKGVPEGAQLSDYVPGYADPKTAAWYQPEKGGLMDPSVRGTIGTALDIATDPLTYETFGESAAARVLAQQAERVAARGNLNRTMADRLNDLLLATTGSKDLRGAVTNPLRTAKSAAELAGRPVANNMEYWGGQSYRSGLRPLDKASAEAGKGFVSDHLMKDRVWGSSETFAQHMLDESERLKDQAMGIMDKADAANPVGPRASAPKPYDHAGYTLPGAPGTPDVVVAPRVEEAVPARRVPGTDHTPGFDIPAKNFEHPGYTLPGESGTPDVSVGPRREEMPTSLRYGPPRTQGGVEVGPAMKYGQAANDLLTGRPVMEPIQKTMKESIDAHAALPRQSGRQTVQLKSDLYSTLPDSAFDASVRTPPGARVRSEMARGLKEAAEAHAEKIGQGDALAKVNNKWGSYLDVRDEAEKMAARDANRPLITRSDATMTAGLGAARDATTGGKYLAIRKLYDMLRATPYKTGLGLGLQGGADARLMGGGVRSIFGVGGPKGGPRYSNMADAWLRQKAAEENEPTEGSPWTLLRQKEEDGSL